MSAAAAKSADAATSADGAGASTPAKGPNKKLIIIIAAAVAVVLALGGVGIAVMMARGAQHAAELEQDDDDLAAAEEAAEIDRKKAARAKRTPSFVPLDPFIVNLTDRDQDRYAQIGITLEIDDPSAGEQMKNVMLAIRNGILMILAHKSSQELLERDGKDKLAAEIMREAVRPLGIEDDNENPIRTVLFSSFIIQ